jgi:CBS domain-containing protein
MGKALLSSKFSSGHGAGSNDCVVLAPAAVFDAIYAVGYQETLMKPVSELLKRADGSPADSAQVRHVRPDTTVFAALQDLARFEVGALVVMDSGALVGVVSERDYTRKVALQGRNSKDTLVADIMTKSVVTVAPSTGTRACMALMSEKKIRHLPVMQGSTVIGMISIRDIMDDIIADHENTIAQLETYIQS